MAFVRKTLNELPAVTSTYGNNGPIPDRVYRSTSVSDEDADPRSCEIAWKTTSSQSSVAAGKPPKDLGTYEDWHRVPLKDIDTLTQGRSAITPGIWDYTEQNFYEIKD